MALMTEDGVIHEWSCQSQHRGHDWTRCKLRVWLKESGLSIATNSVPGTGTLSPVNCLDCLAVRSV